ncbi:deoxyribonuclease HsdR [Psittacicella hinzii]|uniref:Deoxyribonuclease HsdR n=1 Tax=Psittacicella hinzii TaxID=2028575 RepID=A0A3A1YAP0_9GAMM|nr:M48 family metallopeptidase [Psittacicella hinzii]RIY33234.1 deoxyribonuclease HsdR [Psittacicella hinzii]
MQIVKKNLAKLTLLSVFSSVLFGCASIANMAGYDSAKLNEMSAQAYAEVRQEEKANIDTTSNTAKRITRVYNRLLPYADKLNNTGVKFDWQLTVIRKDVINAFAMPGGKIVFYTALIEKLNLNDNEIAAIMGHEMIHALNEHSKQRIGQQLIVSGAVVGSSILTGVSSDSLSILADLGVSKPFSRSNETEADIEGLFLMAQAGYNPENAITLWQKMEAYSGGSSFSLLSTHPSDEKRYKTLQENLPKAMEIYNKAIGKS